MQELFKDMFDTYGDKVYRLALRYTGDHGKAQDLTQETFLRAYKNLDRFDKKRQAGPWLFKIASNLCRNWLRDNRELPMESIEEVNPNNGCSPEVIVIDRENELELARALDSIPEIYREVLLLKHVGDLSYKEICETLDLELSLVKNRLYRGRMILKAVLERE